MPKQYAIIHDLLANRPAPGVVNREFVATDTRQRFRDNGTAWIETATMNHAGLTNLATGDPHTQYQLRSEKGQANGYAPLDSGLLIPRQYLPAVAITSRFTVNSEAAQLALVAQEGDVAIRTDLSRTFIHNGGAAGTMADWDELLTPTDQVTSVDGRAGTVTLGDLYVNEIDHTKAAHDALLLDADTVDGSHAAAFATAAHLHDDRYKQLANERIVERPATDAALTYPLGMSILEVATAVGWPAATGTVETLRYSDGRTVQRFTQKNGTLVRVRWWDEVSAAWSSFGAPNVADFAAAAHVGSRDGHPLATATLDGLMAAADKAKLDRALDVETSQRVVYVSPTGSDTIGDGTSTNRWRTIQYAVNQARAFMQPRNATSAYKIVCAAGTYDEVVRIPPNEFSAFTYGGSGGIWITSETGVASDVLITSALTSGGVVIAYGSCTLDKVTVEHDTAAVWVQGAPGVLAYVVGCTLRRRSLSNGGTAAILAQIGRAVSHNNVSVSGQLFGYGLRADSGTVIAKAGVQPSGATANEITYYGGAIR